MDYKLKNRDGVETTYTKEKLKIPAATGDSMVVFTQGEVQAEKTVTITENGTTEVTPDAGYGSVKKVGVTVDVPAQEVAMQEVPLDPVSSGDYYSINLSEFFNTNFGITQTVVNGIDIGKYYGKGLEYLKIDVILTMTGEDGSTNSAKSVLYWGFDSVASLATGMGYNQAVFSNHYGSITAICYNVSGDGGADPILIKFNLNANSLAETMASQAKAAILAANGMTEDEAQSAGITISTSNPVINLFEVQAGGI